MDATSFARGAAGGALIAAATTALMAAAGHTGGISGILGGLPRGDVTRWRLAFLAGLLAAGAVLRAAAPAAAPVFGAPLHVSWGVAALGGVLTGFGTRLASGCTSGHGVIGLARLSPRSLAAVAVFMATAAVTAVLARGASLAPTPVSGGGDGADGWASDTRSYVLPLLGALAVAGTLHGAAHGRKSAAPLEDTLPSPRPGADSDDDDAAAAAAAAASWATFAAAQSVSFSAALVFGLGLGVSGMCDPRKVLRFLDPGAEGGWDPQLAAVMAAGVAINAVTFRHMATAWGARVPPLFAATADGARPHPKTLSALIPYGPAAAPNRVVDSRLVVGSAMFGVGWGLTGVCPGPGVVAYVGGGGELVGVALPGILVGMALYEAAGALGYFGNVGAAADAASECVGPRFAAAVLVGWCSGRRAAHASGYTLNPPPNHPHTPSPLPPPRARRAAQDDVGRCTWRWRRGIARRR